jgi:hypothetical protein
MGLLSLANVFLQFCKDIIAINDFAPIDLLNPQLWFLFARLLTSSAERDRALLTVATPREPLHFQMGICRF